MSTSQRFFMLSATVFLLSAVVFPTHNVSAGTFVAFSAKDYPRAGGTPQIETDLFSVYNPNTSFTIHIYNGGNTGQFDKRVASAVIMINDVIVCGPRDFNQNIGFIERPVILEKDNELSIELRSAPGSGLTVEISGVDNEPPAISAIVTPPPNAHGWNNSDVTVEFVCSDSISGVAFCPPPVPVQTEGANQVITGTAIDNAGNEASVSVTVNLDKTAPQISADVYPSPNSNGWNNSDVTVDFSCSDNISDIDSCPVAVVVDTEGSGQVISGTATDYAGNETSMSVTINLDKTAPQITATIPLPEPETGWYTTDVPVEFACSDNLSGIDSCPAPSFLVQTEGANQEITGTAIDSAGNEASTSVTISLDKTPPVVTITSPLPGATVGTTPVTVTGLVSDNLSGIALLLLNGTGIAWSDVTGSFSADMPLEGGENSINVSALDSAGNEGNASINVTYTASEIPRWIIEKFAPQLRFDNGDQAVSGYDEYPMSAQNFFEVQVLEGRYEIYHRTDGSKVTENKCPTYWHAITCGKQIRIFYWWFYGYQDNCAGFPVWQGSHSGDWEHIMVTLSEDTTQLAAVTYYVHGGQSTKFSGNGRILIVDNTHPVVFVGRISHGSYDNWSDVTQTCEYWQDHREGNGPTMNCWLSPLIPLKAGEEEWMDYSLTHSFCWNRWGECEGPWDEWNNACGTQPYKDRHLLNCDYMASCYQLNPPYSWSPQGCNWGHTECQVGDWKDPGYDLWCKSSCKTSYYMKFYIPTTDIGLTDSACPSDEGYANEPGEPDVPETFEIAQNYPNPFNPTTMFQYGLPEPGRVTIDIYNILGQRVRSLLDQEQSAGYYTIPWDGTDADGHSLSSGVYFYRIQAGGNELTKKMLLLK